VDRVAGGDERKASVWIASLLVHELVHQGGPKWAKGQAWLFGLEGAKDSQLEGFAWGVQAAFLADDPDFEGTFQSTIESSMRANGADNRNYWLAFNMTSSLLHFIATGERTAGLNDPGIDKSRAEHMLAAIVLGSQYEGPDVEGDVKSLRAAMDGKRGPYDAQ